MSAPRESGLRMSGAALADFLSSQRWFGDRTRAVRGAEVRDVIPIVWPGTQREFAVARVVVTVEDGGSVTYQLFLDPERAAPHDILADPEFLRGLADAFRTGATFGTAGHRWVVSSEGKAPIVVPPDAPITLLDTEQSNSSVVMNREAILKLFRKLQPGIHPDVEITRFLTIERLFVHVPVLLGTIQFEDAEGTTLAGMMQEYVRGAVDGWSYALDVAGEYFRSETLDGGEIPLATEAEHLGIVTRALHEALASGDPGSAFEHRDASRADVQSWTRRALDTATRALDALERAIANGSVQGDAEDARRVARRRDEIAERITGYARQVGDDAGASTRVHGDFHLGQVLRSPAKEFLIIDFEGEPARPLDERRARRSPLVDVAGMLRSFAYAAATSPDRERGARWETAAREAFLRGYFATPTGRQGPPLLPRRRENTDRLTALFECEKVCYELQYELDHRPDWVWIPLRGLAALAA
jgi:maltose alpha-D-glucosyltransferase/alpha-amylase